MQALEDITQAICDSDFDGLMAGAILKRVKPEINVIFSHAALIRSGAHDDIIARNRCEISGRPHGVYRKLKISRIALRDMASSGKIPGITKSSW